MEKESNSMIIFLQTLSTIVVIMFIAYAFVISLNDIRLNLATLAPLIAFGSIITIIRLLIEWERRL